VTSVESEKPFDIFFGRTQKVRLSKKKPGFSVENEEKKASLTDIFFGRTRHHVRPKKISGGQTLEPQGF
jgi:hypothetical protein